MSIEVHKFGGSLLKDSASIKQICNVIANLRRPAIVVVSALFDVTNMLEKAYSLFRTGNIEEANKVLESVLYRHISIASELNIPTSKIYEIIEHVKTLKSPTYAEVVSIGEKLSSYVISEFMKAEGIKKIKYVPAQSFMITSSHQYGSVPILEQIARRMPRPAEDEVIITEGFIGIDSEGRSTTLGREGSDYTATIIASLVGSHAVTLWKNVSGIYNADPVEFKGARIFENIHVSEAIEMTFFGARVLHPRTFTPLEGKNAKLVIRSPFSDRFTTVSEHPTTPSIPVFILHKKVRLITCYLKHPDLMDANDYARIYQLSARYRVPIKLLQKGARSLSIVVPENIPSLAEFMDELDNCYNIRFNDNLFLLTVRHLKHNISEFLSGDVILSEITRQTQHYLLTEWQPIDISAFS